MTMPMPYSICYRTCRHPRRPWLPIYWFFDVTAVARRNLLVSAFVSTKTYADVDAIHQELSPSLKAELRKNRIIPL